MTQAASLPLKQPGAPWPGINTRGGILDMPTEAQGTGQLTDRSTNVIINTMDTLEKRRGFVRGLDERFTGAVCGLHRYTDEQGREWLLVVDEAGFNVRQPFSVPVFETDDRLPNDGFSGTADRPNLSVWNDPNLAYELVDGRLRLKSSLTNETARLRWFKETPASIETEIEYTLDPEILSTSELRVDLLNASASLDGAGLRLSINRNQGTSIFTFDYLNTSGEQELGIGAGGLTSSGTIRVSYNANARVASVGSFPDGGTSESGSATLTELQARELEGWFALTIRTDTAGITSGFEKVSTVPV